MPPKKCLTYSGSQPKVLSAKSIHMLLGQQSCLPAPCWVANTTLSKVWLESFIQERMLS